MNPASASLIIACCVALLYTLLFTGQFPVQFLLYCNSWHR